MEDEIDTINDDTEDKLTRIKSYKLDKNKFESEIVFKERSKEEQIINFSIDTSANRMLIYSEI